MPFVFLTIDTELMWRHHVAGLDLTEIVSRSFEPAGVGVGWQLARLAEHGLKACFFVDPMPALVHGLAPIAAMVRAIRAAGQEVQLHLHPNWTGACAQDRSRMPGRFELIDYSPEEQARLIARARALLIEAGAAPPIAFRAGSYAANDATLTALAAQGFVYDSSHDGSEHPWPSAIGLPPRQIAPVRHRGVTEVPVTVIDAGRRLRHFQICALSAREMRAALDHAVRADHIAVTIVSHGFELANRAGTRPNAVHVRRFESLCRLLAARRDVLPTAHFADRPPLPLDRDDAPLVSTYLRTGLRQAEQLWSNLIEERAG
ncbi:polysaccharide deacetylase [Sphingomonas elodea]|uniref:polysaccharide deacetylase n=1 Tax=Sphingomonas elodea TaxID=179878 RepID=UPI00026302E7|nr:polysaccharide deacetylase [Sphingomonas elodea]